MTVVAVAARSTIRSLAPHLRTEVKWGNPWLVGRDLVVLVGAFSHHVGVEFWRGASLTNRSRLLEGTGKNLRHVKLRTVAEARSREFAALIRDAVRLDSRSEKRVR